MKDKQGFIIDRTKSTLVLNTEATVRDIVADRRHEMARQGAEVLSEMPGRVNPTVAKDDVTGEVVRNPVRLDNEAFYSLIRSGLSDHACVYSSDDNFETACTSTSSQNNVNDPRNVVFSDSDLGQLFVLTQASCLSSEDNEKYKGKVISVLYEGGSPANLSEIIKKRAGVLLGWKNEVVEGSWSLDVEEIRIQISSIQYKHLSLGDNNTVSISIDPSISQIIPAIFTPKDTEKYNVQKVMLHTVIRDERPELKKMVLKNKLTSSDVSDASSLSKLWVRLTNLNYTNDYLSGLKGSSGLLKTTCLSGDDTLKCVGEGGELSSATISIVSTKEFSRYSSGKDAVEFDGEFPGTVNEVKEDLLLSKTMVVEVKASCTGYEDVYEKVLVAIKAPSSTDKRPESVTLNNNSLILNLKNDDSCHSVYGSEDTVEVTKSSVTGTVTVKVDSGSEVTWDVTNKDPGTTNSKVVVLSSTEGTVLLKDDTSVSKVTIEVPIKIVDKRSPEGKAVYTITNPSITVKISADGDNESFKSATPKGSAVVLENATSSLISTNTVVGSVLQIQKINVDSLTVKDQWSRTLALASINNSQLVAGTVSSVEELSVLTLGNIYIDAKASGSDSGHINVSVISSDGNVILNRMVAVTVTDNRTA